MKIGTPKKVKKIKIIMGLWWVIIFCLAIELPLGSHEIVQCTILSPLKEINNENLATFQLISPQNGTKWENTPFFAYKVEGNIEQLIIWLNGTEYSSVENNTLLPIKYRGNYNLTVQIVVDSELTMLYVHFSYVAPISIKVKYNATFVNEHFHPTNYSLPMPVYLFNETVEFYAFSNEANDTLKISVLYGNYFEEKYPLRELIMGVNYTWINNTVMKLTIQPTEVNFTAHELLFVAQSSFDYTQENITFVFNRVWQCSIQIYPSEYQDFLDTPLQGYVSCRFMIYIWMIPAVNVSVFLDHQLVKQMYYPEGCFFPDSYFTVDIDTTQYANGDHLLEIYGRDLFNFTVYYSYHLTFANPTHTDIDTTETPYPFALFPLVLLTLSFVALSLYRKNF